MPWGDGDVCTHVHSVGNSECSGQQTLTDIVLRARDAGYTTVVLAEHSGSPGQPYRLAPDGPELARLRTHFSHVAQVANETGFDLRPGIECNTVLDAGSPQLDVPFELLDTPLGAEYVVGSLHGPAEPYQDPTVLHRAIEMLCCHPAVDTLGHISRYMFNVPISWHYVADMARETDTMVELNLNQWFKDMGQNKPIEPDSFNARFWRQFLETMAESGARLIVGADIHNSGMWPHTTPIAGWETTIERIDAFFRMLAECGIGQASLANFTRHEFDRGMGTPKAIRGILP